MNKNLTEKSHIQLVSSYKKIRKIIYDLQNGALLNYISEKTLDVCGKKLGVMQNKTLVLDDMDQIGVVIDYCLYDYREEGLNAIDRYIDDSHLEPDSEKYRVVKAMLESFYTLVQVENVLPGVGVRVNDVMGTKHFLLADLGLSKTAEKGLVVATRLLPFEDFVTTSGAALPVDMETLEEIFDYAYKHYGTEDGEYIEVDLPQRADLTAAIIRTCLKANASDYIEYEDVEYQPITPIHRETHIGRNEHCPCGSGKKYKRCCGR
ncbi:MAG: SEC-C domain-containing protein [Sedimentisphaerales bacterium]|nr:SEC-C domain-containing protein [Sedimentisphaerales bacterium]